MKSLRTSRLRVRAIALFICLLVGAVSGSQSASLAAAQSQSMFTLNDFKYFEGVTMVKQTKSSATFTKPTEKLCTKHFGKAQKRSATKKVVTLSYAFGTARIYPANGVHDADFVLTIKNAKLPGPRGLRVGDSYQKVLAAFRNDRAGKSLQNGDETADLYYVETVFAETECAVRSGFVTFDEKGKTWTAITYLHDYGEDNWGLLRFAIRDEKVASIEWQFKVSSERLPID